MSAGSSNWSGENWDTAQSPDTNRTNMYQVDNVALQIGLGLPLQVLEVTASNVQRSHVSASGRHIPRIRRPQNNMRAGNVSPVEIQHTIDGIPIRCLYVTNVSFTTTLEDMYRIFSCYGKVINAFIGLPKHAGSRCYGFVTYNNPLHAARVLSMGRVIDQFRMMQGVHNNLMYVKAADSWHQPVEGPNGEIIRSRNFSSQTKQDTESEEENTEVYSEPIEAIQERKDSLNVVNDDCLMHIFSFLDYTEIIGIERVCKRWQALSYRMLKCLHEFNLSMFLASKKSKLEMNTQTLEQCLKRCGESLSVVDLSVSFGHNFTEPTLAIIAKYCTNLETLLVANIPIGSRTLAHLGRRCPLLRKLCLDSCSGFTDVDLISLFCKCSNLTHLELSNNASVIGTCLTNLNSPIESLKLHECPALLPQYLVQGLKTMSSSLKSLELFRTARLDTAHLDEIVAAVPALHSLSLRLSISEFQVAAPLSLGKLVNLTSLDLSLNNIASDQVIGSIVQGCENLASLNLSAGGSGCVGLLTEQGLSAVGRLRKLRTLDISYLTAASSMALMNITTRNPRLRQLTCRSCESLGDEGASHVVSMCTELELFDLSGCSISQQTVDAALTSVKMRTNNVHLRLVVGGTSVESMEDMESSPLLTLDMHNLSEDHMRPDYLDLFFAASDSDDEDDDEDLDELCERIGCNCDFDYDDMYDPTLYFGEFGDHTMKYLSTNINNHDDDPGNWIDDDDDDDDDDGEIYVYQSTVK